MPKATEATTTLGHVLIVEDDRNLAHLVASCLEFEGFVASVAYSAAEAISSLLHLRHHERPDVILTDWELEDSDAGFLCAALHRRSSLARIPLVLMTGRSDAHVLAKRIAAHHYLKKPFDLDDAIAALESAIAHSHREPQGTRMLA